MIDEIARQHLVHRRQRHGGVVNDLNRDTAGAEQEDRTEDRIDAHAEDQFLGMFAFDHRLHGKTLNVALRPKLPHSFTDRAGRFGRGGGALDPQHHAANIRFVRNRFRQQFDGDLAASSEHRLCRLSHGVRRGSHHRFRHLHSIGADDRLGFRFGEHPAPVGRHLLENRQRRGTVDGQVLATGCRHAAERLLGAGPVRQKPSRARDFRGRVDAGYSRFLKDRPALPRRLLAQPA